MNEKSAVPRTGWALTGGMVGHEQQAIGVLEALGIDPVIKRINPKGPFRWLAPFGPAMPDKTVQPPFPDIVVASSRIAAPYARMIRRRSGGKCFVAVMQNPACPASWFDFVWVNEHDRVEGSNVLRTLTAPHRVTMDKLDTESDLLQARVSPLPAPFVSVVLGGPSNAYDFKPKEMAEIGEKLAAYARSRAASLLITPSRRTGDALVSVLRDKLQDVPHWLWDGDGHNPYFGVLGLGEEILVTCDSVNMIGEACFTGKPVRLLPLKGGTDKFKRFHADMIAQQAVCWFDEKAPAGAFKRLDSMGEIVGEISRLYQQKYAG
ncbi:MAG: mitochondrial fission ELM1 family protein [Pseudomonadota bacterium]